MVTGKNGYVGEFQVESAALQSGRAANSFHRDCAEFSGFQSGKRQRRLFRN